MRSTALSILLALLVAAPSAAQDRPTWAYSAGLASETGERVGFTTALSGTFRTPWRAVDFRLDAVYQQTRFRNLLGLGSVVVRPWQDRPAPYLVAGSGVYLDAGVNPAWSAGLGFEFEGLGSAPLFLEYRMIVGPDQSAGLSMGIRF